MLHSHEVERALFWMKSSLAQFGGTLAWGRPWKGRKDVIDTKSGTQTNMTQATATTSCFVRALVNAGIVTDGA
jgi:hypothetical protein